MQYTREESDVIIADGFRELNYKSKKLFLASMKGGEKSAVYREALIKSCGEGVYIKLREKFSDGQYRKDALASLERKKVAAITIKSGLYPQNLKQIDVPPLVLYARGNTELLKEKMFCIVGSRKTTPQAIEECKAISGKLSEHFAIVTGVADGADRAAALGALPYGKAVCVLPCGHHNPDSILEEVESEGLSLSEFPPGVPAQQYMFTLRNRILAGISEGVLVVSAGVKGGALSTAGYAANYGKDVFAFPYNIGIASGEGCNNLIKSGAYLCDSVQDIFSAMGISCGDEGEMPSALSDGEREVLETIGAEGEIHAEKLSHLTGKNMAELSAICAMLEIKGFIVRTGGNKYAAVGRV